MKKILIFLLLISQLGQAQNLFARQNFAGGGVVTTFNTEIGGISGVVTSATQLGVRLGISNTRIQNFTIVGADVKCNIVGGSYTLNNFWSNTDGNIDSFYDYDGLVTNLYGITFNNTAIKYCYFPNVTSIDNGAFDQNFANSNNLATLYIPRATTIGSTVLNNNVFRSGNLGAGYIYVHPSLQTINSGGVEGDIAYLATGNNIRYVANFTAPNPVTTLSAGNRYDTAIQLNFTPPTGSTNAIELYNCYFNGIFKGRVTGSGETIRGLTVNTNYNITLKSVDIFGNSSVDSNVLSTSTTNNSEDADAFNYAYISNNLSYFTAINTLFTSLKSNSLYTKIHAMYLFLGTTSTQHKWNAKNPVDTNASFRLVFSGSGTFSNNGYQLNGTNAYANTFLSPSVTQSINNAGITVVVGTNNTPAADNAVEIGSQKTSPFETFAIRRRNGSGRNQLISNLRLINPSSTVGGDTDARGITTAVLQSNTSSKLFLNGSVVSTITTANSGSMPAVNYFIGALSFTGSPFYYSNQRIQTTMIHEGFSDAEVGTLYTIIDTFENAVGRKTW